MQSPVCVRNSKLSKSELPRQMCVQMFFTPAIERRAHNSHSCSSNEDCKAEINWAAVRGPDELDTWAERNTIEFHQSDMLRGSSFISFTLFPPKNYTAAVVFNTSTSWNQSSLGRYCCEELQDETESCAPGTTLVKVTLHPVNGPGPQSLQIKLFEITGTPSMTGKHGCCIALSEKKNAPGTQLHFC